MVRLSIAFQGNKRLGQYARLAEVVERYPFDAITLYEDLMFQPVWQPLSIIARHTERVRLGPAIVNPYLRHPAVIAGEFALLNEAAGGRAYLGLGRGAFLEALKLDQPRPIMTVRETIQMVRRLLRDERTPYEGERFHATEEAYFRWQPPHREVPILVGTWGPKMAAMAGEIADEVKVGGCWNPAFVPLMRDYVARGAARAGRDPAEVGIVVGAVTVVDEDGAVAEALARHEVAMYLPVIIDLDPTLEVEAAELGAVKEACERGDIDEAAASLSVPTLRKLACYGTPEDVIGQVAALAEAGAARVEFGTPHGRDEVAAIRLLGERVLPHFHSDGGSTSSGQRRSPSQTGPGEPASMTVLQQNRRLHEIGAEMAHLQDEEALLYLAVSAARELTGATYSSIAFVEGDWIHWQSAAGKPIGEVVGVKQPVSEGLCGWVVRHGRSRRSGDVTEEPDYYLQYAEMRSELDVPILHGNRVIGVLSAESPEIDAFTVEHEHLLQILAAYVAIAVS